MNDRILVLVHTANKGVQTFEVDENEHVKVIEERLKSNVPLILYYNNMLLMKNFSFKFYEITNGDHIYTSESQSLQAYSYIGKQVQSLRNEAERLKDILFQKIEGSSTYSRKLMNRFNQFLSHQEKNFDDPPTKAPKESSEPNVEALPSLWEKTAPVLC